MKTLKELREKLDQLTRQASAKLAEIKDDTAEDAARAIEMEHEELLRQIEATKIEISEKEQEERRSSQVNPAAERTRAAEIIDIGSRAGLDQEAIMTAVRDGTSLDAFRRRAFDHLAERSRSTGGSGIRVERDATETRRAAMVEALSYRFGAPQPQGGPGEPAREFISRGLIEIAADCAGVQLRGIPNARQIDEIYTRAGSHSTSDFPIIFENAINRTLEQRFALAQPTYRRIARRRNFRDFRPHKTVKLGDFPMLEKVAETGEIKYGTFSEGAETISVLSYAKAMRVTRQMLINDDLGAIAEILMSYGETVALFEEIVFYASAFNGNLADGKAVFHADHKNLAGAGTVIDVDNVGKARAAMQVQKSLEGNPLLSNAPRILLTGPDKQTEAEKLLASITPATVSNVNIFSGRLEQITSLQLSGNSWYLAADPATGICNWRWGYLDGYEAPRVRMDEPFGVQGVAMSVEHDFGCGAVDYRGAYKNPGA